MVKPIDIQYYDSVKGELVHTQEYKAKKFIEHECIVWSPEERCFICKPIKGYNVRTYHLIPDGSGHFSCDCQGYRKKERDGDRPFCSHVFALYLAFKTKTRTTLDKWK